jgi:hypothetical protein
MTGLSRASVIAALCTIAGTPSLAGPERVVFPASYAKDFLHYNTVDRPDRKRVRLLYVNATAHAAARPGEPLPYGTILVMEDRDAAVDESGNLKRDNEGRLIPTDIVSNVFVMEKQKGWGEAFSASIRNGDWDYAWYLADGMPKADATFDGCFSCHLPRREKDFTFTYWTNVKEMK